MADSSERRQNIRARKSWPVTVETTHGSIEGETVNISPAGGYIQCPLTPDPGDMVALTISPNDHPPMKIKAEVIWVATAPPFGMGVIFEEISNADRSYLSEVVQRQLG